MLSSSTLTPSRLGRGKLDSGPAIPCRISKLVRRFILVVGIGKDEGGGEVVDIDADEAAV